jgi:peptidoglycan/LPS O-acetylase OafA/YrhL
LLRTLQAGRAIAATAVLAFHLSIMMGERRYGGDPAFRDYVLHGNLGVDFFFVLSGFIILFAHEKDIGRPGRWLDYTKRRLVRLYPVYWLYTALFVAAFAVAGGVDAEVPTSWADIAGTVSLVRFSAVEPPLPVAWTLFHEVMFYAMFLLLIVNVRLGIAAFAAWAAMCLVFFHHIGTLPPTPFNAYTATCNLWFFFGMGACLLYKRMRTGLAAAAAGVAILLVAATLDLEHILWPLMLVAGFALALAGIARIEARGWLRCPGWLVSIGNASYTIYLTHESIAGVILKIAMKSGAYALLGANAIYMITLGATLALGCATYAAVERPLLRRLSGLKRSPAHAGRRGVLIVRSGRLAYRLAYKLAYSARP